MGHKQLKQPFLDLVDNYMYSNLIFIPKERATLESRRGNKQP